MENDIKEPLTEDAIIGLKKISVLELMIALDLAEYFF